MRGELAKKKPLIALMHLVLPQMQMHITQMQTEKPRHKRHRPTMIPLHDPTRAPTLRRPFVDSSIRTRDNNHNHERLTHADAPMVWVCKTQTQTRRDTICCSLTNPIYNHDPAHEQTPTADERWIWVFFSF